VTRSAAIHARFEVAETHGFDQIVVGARIHSDPDFLRGPMTGHEDKIGVSR
jgi:hypothetical protein